MFGIFRFVLALMVVLTHIGGVEIVASIAVWSFFMLSGFLMTAVLNKKYGFSFNGLVRFCFSRATRLFPSYWLTTLLAMISIYAFSTSFDAEMINSALALPNTLYEVLANILIVGQTTIGIGRIENALSPSAWAVDVEIAMYVCSCLFLSRSEYIARNVLLGLGLAFPLLWLMAKHLIELGFEAYGNQVVYSFLPAALLPYTIGVYIWFNLDRIPKLWLTNFAFYLSVSWIGACIFIVSKYSVTATYVFALPAIAIIIIRLSNVDRSGQLKRIDEILGQMSYPIYLLHWLCAYIFIVVTFGTAPEYYSVSNNKYEFTLIGFGMVSMLTLVLAFIFSLIVERPLERVRHSLFTSKR